MKSGYAATVVIGKASPLHPVWYTRTKFFCNKLNEDTVALKVQISLPADALM